MPRFAALDRDLSVDVVVVGAGVTGITTAWLLREAGCRVALIERGRVARADTGNTTAHLTYVTDGRLHRIAKDFGADAARTIWQGGAAAIEQIAAIVDASQAKCSFRRVPGFLHAPVQGRVHDSKEEIRALQADAELAAKFGFRARFVQSVPGHPVPGVQFDDQAAFDPGAYLAAMLQALPGENCRVFENTALQSVAQEPGRIVTANGHEIRCDYIVVATHDPLGGSLGAIRAGLFQTKLALYTSYVIGAQVPSGTIEDALFWDTADPYDYLRIEQRADHQLVIFGGADNKTAQGNDRQAFEELGRRLQLRVPGAAVTHCWLGQVIETDDGLPFIGEHAPGEFIATGFAGNGFTFGTLAAMMARDRFLGRPNPWSDLMRVDRKPFHGGLWSYLSENVDYPKHLVGDRLRPAGARDLQEVPPGEGRIVKLEQGTCAAYRNVDGRLSVCSAVCTHLKCLVRWNGAAGTWDCPCHGSRFSTDGAVLSGPAETPLQRIDLQARSG